MLGRVVAEMDHPQSAGAIQDVQRRKAGYAETLCGWSPGAKGIDGRVEHQLSFGEVGLRFSGCFPVISRIEGKDQDVEHDLGRTHSMGLQSPTIMALSNPAF
jgi:hypothetical protein